MSDYGEQSIKRAEIELKLNEHWANVVSHIGSLLGTGLLVHLIWAIVTVRVAHMMLVENGWIVK